MIEGFFHHYSDVKWASIHLNSPASQEFVLKQFIQAHTKGNLKAIHHWPCVRGIYQWLVDSSHKDLVLQKSFSCHELMMIKLTLDVGDDVADSTTGPNLQV